MSSGGTHSEHIGRSSKRGRRPVAATCPHRKSRAYNANSEPNILQSYKSKGVRVSSITETGRQDGRPLVYRIDVASSAIKDLS